MKRLSGLIVLALTFAFLAGQGWAIPPLPPTIYRDTDCSQTKYNRYGILCHDTDDGKYYKWNGAAMEEIAGTTIAGTHADGDCAIYNEVAGEWQSSPCPGAGAGAPEAGEYVTYTSNATLTAEKVLTDAGGVDFVQTATEFRINVDLTELINQTWGAGEASSTHTFNVSGTTDPVWTYSDGVANLSAGTLQQAGVAVQIQGTDIAAAVGNNEFTIRADVDSTDTLKLQAYDVGSGWDDIITITSSATPTLALAADGAITIVSGSTVTVESVVFTAGALSSVTSITDGTASWTGSSLSGFADITLTDDLTVGDDLLLASGAVISWDTTDITLTHSANTLTLAGGDLALGAGNVTLTGYIAFGADPADAEPIRLSNNTKIGWEIATPGVDVTLGVNASDDMVAALVAATDIFQITTGNFQVGAGTKTQTFDGADAYITGFLEVDGMIHADGGVTGALTGTASGNIALTALVAKGDLLTASAASTPAVITDVAAGQPLLSGGVAQYPAYAGYTFSGTGEAIYTFPGATATLADLDANTFSGDQLIYDAVNDGNPVWAIGSAAAERMTITATYNSGAQTIDYVTFATVTESATADDGQMIFSVDGTTILTIKDGGILVVGDVFLPSTDADPSSISGALRHDTTITDLFAGGALKYYNGAAVKQLVDMTTALAEACTDDQIIAYDTTADGWYCKDDATAAADPTLQALADLVIADVSVITGTGIDAFEMIASGGNNYILGSNATNAALEFKTPAAVLSEIGAQASNANLTTLGGLTAVEGKVIIGSATPLWDESAFTLPIAACAEGQIWKMTAVAGVFACAADEGGSTALDDIGDPDAATSISLGDNEGITLESAEDTGIVLLIKNTDADLAGTTSLLDLSYNDDGSANGYFIRGYDNAYTDLKFSIGADGAASFGALTASSLSVSDGNITNVGDIAVDSISNDGTNITIIASDAGTVTVESVVFTSDAITGVASLAASTYIALGADPADAGSIRLPNAGYIMAEADATGTDISVIGVDSSEIIQIGASGASGVTITPATTITGHVTLEGVTSTGATGTGKLVFDTAPVFTTSIEAPFIVLGSAATAADAGAIRLPNAAYIMAEADAAAADISVIGVDSSEIIQIGASGASGVTITPATTITGHVTLEGVTSTGATGTGNLVFATTPTLTTPVLGAATGTSLAFGADPADAGAIRLSNADVIAWEASAAGTDVVALSVDASEIIQIGSSGASGVTITPATTITGHVTLEGVTSTGATGTGKLVFDTAPVFTTSMETPFIILGSAATAADAGAIRLPNAAYIMAEADVAGTDISIIGVDSSEVVQIAASGASGVTITPNTTFTGDITISGGNINTGAVALVVGDATTTSITFTTDGTGTGEIVFPNESIGKAEIQWGTDPGVDMDAIPNSATYEKVNASDVNASGHVDYIWTTDGTPKSITFQGLTANRIITLQDAAQTVANLGGIQTFTGAKTFNAITIAGDITQTGGAYDWDLVDENASALSFDTTGKAGILEIVTTDSNEGIRLSGFIALGADPADATTASNILMSNNTSIIFEDTEGTGEVNALSVNTSEYVLIGSSGADGVTITPDTTITGDLTVGGSDLTLNATGVKLTGGTGILTIAGVGGTYNENLTIDLEPATDTQTITFSTGTGVTTLDFNAFIITTNGVRPDADGGASLGVANTAEWSNLYLNTGAVIGFENGDVVLTHSANTLTLSGDSTVTLALGSNNMTSSGYISFGADPADDTGVIRLSNNTALYAENATPGTDIYVIGTDASNIIQIGASGASGVTITPSTVIGNLTLNAAAITSSTGAISFNDENLSTTGTLAAGVTTLTGELRLLSSNLDPTAVAGALKHDSVVTGMSGGALRWNDASGVGVRLIVDLDTDPADNAWVVAYSSSLQKFYMKQDADSGGSPAWDSIGAPTGNDEIDFGAYTIELNVTDFQIGDGSATNAVIFTGAAGGEFKLGSTGVQFTGDADGAFTMKGLGGGTYDEDLTLNFDDTENTVSVSSSTGVTTIDFGSIVLNAGGFTAVASATPNLTFSDSDASAVGTGDIKVDALTAGQDSLLRLYVDDSTGEDTLYVTVDGTNEEILFAKKIDLSSAGIENVGAIADDGAITIISSGSTVTVESVVFTGGAISAATTLAMGGALSGVTTATLTHTAPDISLIDSDTGAAGTGNLLFASAGTQDVVGTLQADIAGIATTFISLDGVNEEVLFGKKIDIATLGIENAGALGGVSTLAMTGAQTGTTAITMGSATVDTGVFTMIKGAQTSDPQVTFTLSSDGVGGFTIATANGSNGDITLTPSGGETILTTDLTVLGGDIVLGTTSIFSGGDTASLNNIDAIDATTEATIEAALDTLANVTSLGTLTTLTVDNITINENTISSAGNIILDAVNAAANSTVAIGNSAATYVANVTVDGNLSAATYGSTGTVTDAELLFLADVTSAIQAQFTGKASLTSPAFITSILPSGAGATVIGTTALPFSSIFIGDAATNNVQLINTDAASAVVLTLPSTTGTLALTTLVAVDFGLTADADAGDYDILSIDKLEGFDSGVFIDMGADGIVTIQSDTNLDLNVGDDGLRLTDGTNQVIINTGDGMGVTSISFSALNLVTTGTIRGAINVTKDDDTLAADQCYGTAHWLSGGAETVTLPAAVVGMNLLVYSSDATVKNIDPNGTDTIVLNGVALAAGYQIESPGAVGNFIALVCFTANQWTTLGQSGVWVTHGAD